MKGALVDNEPSNLALRVPATETAVFSFL